MAASGTASGEWAHRGAFSVGLLLLLAVPSASAQGVPPVPGIPSGSPDEGVLLLNLGAVGDEAYHFVRPGGQLRVQLEVVDMSADRAQDARNPFPHTIALSASIVEPQNPIGWTVSVANNTLFTAPGTTAYATLVVSPLFSAVDNYLTIAINGTLTSSSGGRVTDDLEIRVQLLPFFAGRARVVSAPVSVGQFEVVRYEVEIENQATYPDAFFIHLNATPGFTAKGPDRITLEPLERRTFNVTIVTPVTGFYEWGTLGIVAIEIRSQGDPAFRYMTSAIIGLKGFYFHAYWIPITLFVLLAAGLLLDKRLDKRAERIGREGRPRYPRPTPRQAVLLAELKKRDPATYKEKKAALDALWAARKAEFKATRKAQREEERRLAAEHRAAAKAEKKRRKAEKARAAEEQERLEAERKAKAKALAAEQKVLDKTRAKEAKVQAKADKRRRKELEKESKVRAKELAKAKKAEERRAKAEAKAARKSGKESPEEPPSAEAPNQNR